MTVSAPSRQAQAQDANAKGVVGTPAPASAGASTSSNGLSPASMFEPMKLADIQVARSGRETKAVGVLNAFLSADIYAAKLNLDASESTQGAKPQVVAIRLTNNARRMGMPLKAKFAKGSVYLIRLDRDEDGNTISDWREKAGRKRRKATDAGSGNEQGQ